MDTENWWKKRDRPDDCRFSVGCFTARTILPDDEQVGDLAEDQRVVRARGLFTVT